MPHAQYMAARVQYRGNNFSIHELSVIRRYISVMILRYQDIYL